MTTLPELPVPQDARPGATASPMVWVDEWFCRLAEDNPAHRVRVGSPGSLRSQRMNRTLTALKHCVLSPGNAEIADVLAGGQGINLVVSDEGRVSGILDIMRHQVDAVRRKAGAGEWPPWLSVPVIASFPAERVGRRGGSCRASATSDTWLEEKADTAPMFFPFDANTAVATLQRLYGQRGRVAMVVVARAELPVLLDGPRSERVLADGAVTLQHDEHARIQLLALGSCQLQSVLRAADVLRCHGVPCSVVAIIEPGRFRQPRDAREAQYVHNEIDMAGIIPPVARRLFVSRTRSEPLSRVLQRLDTGPGHRCFLGYCDQSGAADSFEWLFANHQSWAHIVRQAAGLLDEDPAAWLANEECAALAGRGVADVLR